MVYRSGVCHECGRKLDVFITQHGHWYCKSCINVIGSLRSSEGTLSNDQLLQMMGDAPFCERCGHITVRNGSTWKCLNCGWLTFDHPQNPT